MMSAPSSYRVQRRHASKLVGDLHSLATDLVGSCVGRRLRLHAARSEESTEDWSQNFVDNPRLSASAAPDEQRPQQETVDVAVGTSGVLCVYTPRSTQAAFLLHSERQLFKTCVSCVGSLKGVHTLMLPMFRAPFSN